MAFTSEEIENFTFGPNDDLDLDLDIDMREIIQVFQVLQRAYKRSEQQQNETSTKNESETDNKS